MNYFERYLSWHQARSLRWMASPMVLVAMLELTWIEFRWRPAIVFTPWLLLGFFLARRKLAQR